MLLGIDIGNTNIVIACQQDDGGIRTWRLETNAELSQGHYRQAISECVDEGGTKLEDAIIASVVPLVTPLVKEAVTGLSGREPLVIGAPETDLGIAVNIHNPSQAGADRLVNAVGAQAHHSLPAIILDFGTATTLDLVGADGSYEGGVIAPGVALSITALEAAAAQLPRLELRAFDADLPVLGKNTVEAMESGLFWGYVSMIEGLLARLRLTHGDVPAIATGGLASLFADHLTGLVAVDSDLTVKGLFEIYARNRGSTAAARNG